MSEAVSLSQPSVSDSPDVESKPKPPALDVPIDGGLQGWLQVVGSFILFFTSWGIVNSFGVFQTYYESDSSLSASSPSDISWVGSIQAFLLVFGGAITGPIFDLGYLRCLLLLGTFLTVFGIMMTSIASQYYQILLAQGICIGLGSGCLFVPSIAIVATYFTKRRALATGIATAGSSLGGIIYPIAFRGLEPLIGFGWATRVLGFMTLVLLCVSIAIMKQRTGPRPPRSLWLPSAFRVIPYTLVTFGITLIFIGMYFPVFYIQSYALTEIPGISHGFTFYLLVIINAAGVFGRILPTFIAAKVGLLNVFVPSALTPGILCLCWIPIKNVAGIVTFAILYGFFFGAFIGLVPAVVAQLTPDMAVVGTYMGMCLAIGAMGLLIGNPVAGALVGFEEEDFYRAQIFAGAAMVLGATFIGMVRILRGRQLHSWKV
ncbi:hypothetical protein MMC17_000140 [Xylographa soralifera]|nr:hypothetical protein [Xylographa soralifera]